MYKPKGSLFWAYIMLSVFVIFEAVILIITSTTDWLKLIGVSVAVLGIVVGFAVFRSNLELNKRASFLAPLILGVGFTLMGGASFFDFLNSWSTIDSAMQRLKLIFYAAMGPFGIAILILSIVGIYQKSKAKNHLE